MRVAKLLLEPTTQALDRIQPLTQRLRKLRATERGSGALHPGYDVLNRTEHVIGKLKHPGLNKQRRTLHDLRKHLERSAEHLNASIQRRRRIHALKQDDREHAERLDEVLAKVDREVLRLNTVGLDPLLGLLESLCKWSQDSSEHAGAVHHVTHTSREQFGGVGQVRDRELAALRLRARALEPLREQLHQLGASCCLAAQRLDRLLLLLGELDQVRDRPDAALARIEHRLGRRLKVHTCARRDVGGQREVALGLRR